VENEEDYRALMEEDSATKLTKNENSSSTVKFINPNEESE